MSAEETPILFGAAFIAGAINSIAGGGSLVSFPTLLWLGRDPILANATNTVALWPGSLAAALGYRRELRAAREWMVLLGIPSVAGGVLGAFLLLRTSSRTFGALVPYLILFATGLVALQGPIAHALRRAARDSGRSAATAATRLGGQMPRPAPDAPRREWWPAAALFQLGVAVYGGYFGAGIGIMMLAALGLLGFASIHQALGLRNFCGTCINGVAALYFACFGTVAWPDALVMTAGQIAGGYGGTRVVRRLDPRVVRAAVVVIGVAIATALLAWRER